MKLSNINHVFINITCQVPLYKAHTTEPKCKILGGAAQTFLKHVFDKFDTCGKLK